jgi:adenylate kinase family enzyme
MKNSKKISNFKFQIPKVIILMGPPGSGKGTQAELLAERLNLFHLETSKILEEKFKEKTKGEILIEGKKYSFSKEKKLWEEGKLCSPPSLLI